jgi:hypothetical protein
MPLRFSWDPNKSEANRRKHRVAFEEALTVFSDAAARILDDPSHSSAELREIIVGHSHRGRVLLVSFTERDGLVRIISARRATRHEKEDYESENRD